MSGRSSTAVAQAHPFAGILNREHDGFAAGAPEQAVGRDGRMAQADPREAAVR